MHVVLFHDFEHMVTELDAEHDRAGFSVDAINELVEKAARIRGLDPINITHFTLRELLLYKYPAALMGCLPFLRRTAEMGVPDNHCDEIPAAEFLGRFYPEEAKKFADGAVDPHSPLFLYDFGYEGVGLDEMLSQDPVIRTQQLR